MMSRANEASTSSSDEPPDLENQLHQPDAVTSIPPELSPPANSSKEATKGQLSRNSSGHEQCRICQQDKDEGLIDLGCHCRGDLAKAHRSCIDTWFRSKGSNKCEICQGVASNVSAPESQPTTNYWVWRVEYRMRNQYRGCMKPLWLAFSFLIGGLLLVVLISTTLGISAVPINIIIGVIVVLGLGTVLRLALVFCHEWSTRSIVHRMETQGVPLGYHPGWRRGQVFR